jgi:hypothetical protein
MASLLCRGVHLFELIETIGNHALVLFRFLIGPCAAVWPEYTETCTIPRGAVRTAYAIGV